MISRRRNRKAPPCPKCGRPIEYYGALGEYWCGSVTCQIRPSLPAAPGGDGDGNGVDLPQGGRERATGPRQLEPEPEAVLVNMAQVQPEKVRWLWPGRIPLGKLTIAAGPPGVGKSTAVLDVAAKVTRGSPLPDGGTAPLGDVVLLTAEDGLADTVRPRLDLAGADSSRVHALTMIRKGDAERMFSLEEHLPVLERAIIDKGACLAVIDPLLAFSGRADSYKDSEVRGLLAPLAALAERTGCAVVGILHLNKRGGERSPLNRITGSIAFVAAARSALLLAADPDDDSGRRRVLAGVKMNLCAMPPSLALHFAEDGGLIWEGAVGKGAEALLAAPADDGERDALAEAEEFLRDLLADGAVDAEEGWRQARKLGIAERTLKRAKAALHVKAHREGFGPGGRWVWEMPIEGHRGPEPIYKDRWPSMAESDTKTGQEAREVVPYEEKAAPCPHRPLGETDDRWARGVGSDDPHACTCCGGPVQPNLWVDSLCPVCRNGRPAKEGSGHLTRMALDLGARPVLTPAGGS